MTLTPPSLPRPFRLDIPEADLLDLGTRLARTRFPYQAPGEAWPTGTDLSRLSDLLAYWAASLG